MSYLYVIMSLIGIGGFKMYFQIILKDKGYKDFIPMVYGYEFCKKGKVVRPFQVNEYLIHFVIDGRGKFIKPYKTYDVEKGNAFLMRPGEQCCYIADDENPWKYIWIHFSGISSKWFENVPDVFSVDSEITDMLFKGFELENNFEEYVAGMLFLLYSKLKKEKTDRDDYPEKIKRYIDLRYSTDISIESIAASFFISRKYASKLFKERYNVTIQQYLIKKRLDSAKQLIKCGHSIERSAYMSGYKDSFNFSKSFKKCFGISPSEYKKKLQNKQ